MSGRSSTSHHSDPVSEGIGTHRSRGDVRYPHPRLPSPAWFERCGDERLLSRRDIVRSEGLL